MDTKTLSDVKTEHKGTNSTGELSRWLMNDDESPLSGDENIMEADIKRDWTKKDLPTKNDDDDIQHPHKHNTTNEIANDYEDTFFARNNHGD